MYSLAINSNLALKWFKILFYSFPFSLFCASGYFNLYFFILIISGYFCLSSVKKKIIFEKIDKVLFLFFSIIFLSTIFNTIKTNDYISTVKALSLFRFFFLFILIKNFFFYKLINIHKLSLVIIISCVAMTLDIFLQVINEKGIFGYIPLDGRIVGFFYFEAIAGSYLQKFFLLALIFFFLLKKNNILYANLYLIIIYSGIFLTLDRMPLILALVISIILPIMLNKKLFLSLFFFLIIFVIILNNNKNTFPQLNILSERVSIFYSKIIMNLKIETSKIIKTNNKDIKKDYIIHEDNKKLRFDNYDKLYKAGINIFLDNLFIGIGHKQFITIACNNIRYNYACSQHPHHLWLEIATTSGVIGIFLFLYFLFLIFYNFYKSIKYKNYTYLFILMLIIEVLPFRSYGSIFSTINGSMFWFLISILGSYKFIQKNLKKDLYIK